MGKKHQKGNAKEKKTWCCLVLLGGGFFLGCSLRVVHFRRCFFHFKSKFAWKKSVADHFTTFAFFSLARSFAHLRRKTTFFDHRDHSKKKYPSDPTTLLRPCNKWPQRCYIWLAKTQVWGPVCSYFKICVANKFRFPFLRKILQETRKDPLPSSIRKTSLTMFDPNPVGKSGLEKMEKKLYQHRPPNSLIPPSTWSKNAYS